MSEKRFYNKISPLFISLIFCTIIFFTLTQYGVTWDESSYISAGNSYVKWFSEPSIDTIDQYWKINNEHPPLHKVMGGISNYIFHKKLHLFDGITAFRISILIFVFLLTYSLFSFVSELYGQKIAFIASASFFFLPRIFFHSHLATLDYPMTAMWFLVIFAYWKGIKDQKWIIWASILLGLALLTKLNALFLYVPIILYWILSFHAQLKSIITGKGRKRFNEDRRIFSKIIPLFIIPPIIFVTLWPWLWKDTVKRIAGYLTFHMQHFEIPVYYLGKQYSVPPFHYPFVLTMVTIPLITLIPFFIGISKINSAHNKKSNMFILFNMLLPCLALSLPTVPKYDGIRLFSPAFPFISIISGIGIHHIILFMKKFKYDKLFFYGYIFLFIISIYSSIIRTHPYQSSYYNETVGGVKGAIERGFESEYWGNAYMGALAWLNQHSDRTFWVYMADIDPKVMLAFSLYKETGLLNKNVKFGKRDNSDYLILLIRQGLFNKEMWIYYLGKKPAFSVKLFDTDLVNIYKIDKK